MPIVTNLLDHARFYRKRRLSILPVTPGTKAPAVPWKDLQERHPTEDELRRWFEHTRNGIAIVCGRVSGVIAVDCDSPEKSRELAMRLPPTPMMTRSSPGKGHLYYRIENGVTIPTRIRIGGLLVDLKAEGSYCLAAPSIHPATRQPYERWGSWDIEHVPTFDPSWIQRVTDEPQCGPTNTRHSNKRGKIKNPRAYIASIFSVQGQNGSAALIRALSVLRDSQFSEQEAIAYISEWNYRNATPPWQPIDLIRATQRVYHHYASEEASET